MKIIDFCKKGNVVRFYLGADDCNDYWGDDWDDSPYEHNAGTVYEEYVSGTADIAFPFDFTVCEPSEDWHNDGNSRYCKEDFKKRKAPCIVAKIKDDDYLFWENCYLDMIADDSTIKFYFGDHMEPTEKLTMFGEECKEKARQQFIVRVEQSADDLHQEQLEELGL